MIELSRCVRRPSVVIIRHLMVGSLVCSGILLWLSPTHAVDQIIRYSTETTVRGDVTKMDRRSITVQRAGGDTVTVPADDLRDLRYDGEPPDVQRARSSEDSGVWDSALEKLKASRDSNTSSDKRIAAEIEFLTARCLARKALNSDADGAKAMQELASFRTANAENVRYYESTLWLARLLNASGQSDDAFTILREIEESGVSGFEQQSRIIRGQISLRAGDGQQALQAFDAAIAAGQGNEALSEPVRDARIGRALSLHLLSKSSEAVAELDSLIRELPESSSTMIAKLWNHKGDVLRTMGESRGALLAYLHVDILYESEEAAHAEALSHLAELWETAGHVDRARDATTRLKQNYPNSPWASNTP